MGERAKGKGIFTFDDDGRLIIQDPELAKAINDHVRESGTLDLSLSPVTDSDCVLPLRLCPPPPPDYLCGCRLQIVPRAPLKNI